MADSNNIAFIGSGKMGEAIINGILSKNLYKKNNIYFHDKAIKQANLIKNKYKINFSKNNKELIKKSKIIILAVKPQVLREVLNEVRKDISEKHLIISIAAGIKIKTIQKILGVKIKIIRVMPNTPCLIGKGISVISKGSSADKNSLKITEKIFSSLGEVVVLNENYLNSVTALSGSGPAFVYRIVEAFIEAGKSIGLKENISKELAVETFIGAVEMIKNSKKKINELVDDVSSPGGTTIAGRNILEKSNYKKIIKNTIKAAKARSEELSRG